MLPQEIQLGNMTIRLGNTDGVWPWEGSIQVDGQEAGRIQLTQAGQEALEKKGKVTQDPEPVAAGEGEPEKLSAAQKREIKAS